MTTSIFYPQAMGYTVPFNINFTVVVFFIIFQNELYCLRCHDKMGIPICGACRRPIEERVVTALGKHWHVEVCIIKVLKSFNAIDSNIHFYFYFASISFVPNVRNPFWDIVTTRNVAWHTVKLIIINCLAICVLYAIKWLQEMVCFGSSLFFKNNLNSFLFAFAVFTALNKAWCVHHFACSVCDMKMTQKSKFYEYDEKPVCKKCYERFPSELRKRLRTAHEMTMSKKM